MTTAALGQQKSFARNQKSSKNTGDPKQQENIRHLFLDRMLSLLPSDVQYFA